MTWDIAIWIWGKKWKPPLNLNVFLLKFPCYLSCIKDIFTIVESWKTKNVTWSFFLLLKLALLSQKMKIQNHTILVHNERFVAPKNQFILCKTVKKISEQPYFKKKLWIGGVGTGRTKLFLKSHNSAHTCRIEKRFFDVLLFFRCSFWIQLI